MKRELVSLLSLLVFSGGCFAQQTDPVLTGAVAAQRCYAGEDFQ